MRVETVVAKNVALREGGSLRRTPDLPAVTEVTRNLSSLVSYAVRPPLFERARLYAVCFMLYDVCCVVYAVYCIFDVVRRLYAVCCVLYHVIQRFVL